MAKQITQLPVAASVAASNVFPLDQSGTTKQATLTAIAAGLPTGTGTGGLVRETNPIFGSGITVGNVRGNADNSAYSVVGGNSAPGVATAGAWLSLYGGTAATNPGALVFGCNTAATGAVTSGGNFGFGTVSPAARAHVFAPALASGTGSITSIARFDNSNGSDSSLRLSQVRTATGSSWETATTRIQQWTDVTPQGFVSFNEVNNQFGVSIGVSDGVNNIPIVNIKASPGNFNVGIGTTNTTSKLTVAGDIRIAQPSSLIFTDAAGTTPSFNCQGDNNFAFYGTNSTGGLRPIFTCFMRSDTSSFNITVPTILGTGSAISAVFTTSLNSFAPAAIAASGGVQFTDVTITGVDGNCSTLVECSGGMSNNSIILKSNVVSTNTIRIYWINPTAASVTLSAANYRISAIKFA